jgi:hypothetical protein
MLRVAIVWKLHSEAFFGYKILKEGHKVPGLKERVERAIAGLMIQAEVAKSDPGIGDLPPGGASNMMDVAEE